MKRRGFLTAVLGSPAVALLPNKAGAEKHGKVIILVSKGLRGKPDDRQEIDLDVPLERQFKGARLAQIRRVWNSQVEDGD